MITPNVTVLATLKAPLDGSNPSTVVDADATAMFIVEIRSDGELRWAATAQAAWVADIIAVRIHRGTAGNDGPAVADLTAGGATFDSQTFSASGSASAAVALAQEIAATPSDFYANISTNAATDGLVRAQLEMFDVAVEFHATLLGSNETAQVDPNARGAATFSAAPDGTVSYVLGMGRPAVTDVTMAHIHVGGAGVDGGIEVDLNTPAGTVDAAAGTIEGTITVSAEVLSRILQDPSGFYCNAHTTAAPLGIARGQLAIGTVEMWATLRGDEETTVIDANARGGASFEFFTFTTGLAILAVPPAQGMAGVNGAHIHVGAAGVDGIVLIDLQAGADYNVSSPTGSADGTITFTQKLLTRLMANPAGFYCNFHTSAAPAGLVRGQLSRDTATVFADLRGNQETMVVDPNAAGSATCVFTGIHECAFTLAMTSPAIGDVIGAHIHDGFAGQDGPILVDLLNGLDVSINGVATGRAVVTGRTFARLLAQADQMYINAHTNLAPNGVARGQCAVLAGDVPPAGLAYTTPVTYLTEVAISPNAPQSTGGAIASYSISPPLPTGLSMNTTTGIISGTPKVVQAAQDYTVTASNAGGSTTATVTITVNESAPASVAYATPVSYVQNSAIAANVPVITGGIPTLWSVNPALPAGLTLSVASGIISGTPTTPTAAANYTVTASNSAGSVMATVNITITAALQPPSITYSTPVTYQTGTAIMANTPTNTGGAVTSWSISPTLPAGLSFSTSTGVISGTPTAITAAANYTVTATNAAGSGQATVNITVNLGPPLSLTYNPQTSIGYVTGGTFTSMTATATGGAVATYTISPALPAGITINATSGLISGSPTAQSLQTNYTVTASNSAGSVTATVTITVLP